MHPFDCSVRDFSIFIVVTLEFSIVLRFVDVGLNTDIFMVGYWKGIVQAGDRRRNRVDAMPLLKIEELDVSSSTLE